MLKKHFLCVFKLCLTISQKLMKSIPAQRSSGFWTLRTTEFCAGHKSWLQIGPGTGVVWIGRCGGHNKWLASVGVRGTAGARWGKVCLCTRINSALLEPYRLVGIFCTLKTYRLIEKKIAEENAPMPWSKHHDRHWTALSFCCQLSWV